MFLYISLEKRQNSNTNNTKFSREVNPHPTLINVWWYIYTAS